MLDAPIYPQLRGDSPADSISEPAGPHQEFVSLPCEMYIVPCKTESDLIRVGPAAHEQPFHHKNPVYQSAHVAPSTADPNAAADEAGDNHHPTVGGAASNAKRDGKCYIE